MWILFLLAFLIIVFIRYWYLMREESIGKPYNTPGHSFYWMVNRYRIFTPPQNYIGIDAVLGFKFRFYPEKHRHRIAKWFGIYREFQTNDPNFDGKVFIESGAYFLGQALECSLEAREAILEILKGNVLYMDCDGRYLWVKLKKTGYEPPGEMELCQLIPHMEALVEILTRLKVSKPPGKNKE